MKKKPRVGAGMAMVLIATAAVFDILQFIVAFIPIADVVLDFFLGAVAWIVFVSWFSIGLHVPYFQGKQALGKVTTLAAGIAIELIPFLDIFPAITAGVVITIALSRIEDMEKTGEKPESVAKFSKSIQAEALRQNQAWRRAQRVEDAKYERFLHKQGEQEQRVRRVLDRVKSAFGGPETLS